MILTSASTPDEYIGCLDGWQRSRVQALRSAVVSSAPELEERLKWGHLVYFSNGPVLLIRAEPRRVLFGFWRGQRLLDIEPRLRPGGKYQMATLELLPETPLGRDTVVRLVQQAFKLNRTPDPAGLLTWPAKDRALLTLASAEQTRQAAPEILAILRAWIDQID